MGLLIVFGIVASFLLLVGVGLVVLAPPRREARSLRRRLRDEGGPSEPLPIQAEPEDTEIVHMHRLSDLPWLDALLKRSPLLLRLERLREQSGSRMPLERWLMLSGVLAAGPGFILDAVVQAPFYITLVGSGLGLVSPFFFLSYLKTQRLKAFQVQFPDALDMLARTLQAGFALNIGMRTVGEEFPAPLGIEFVTTVDQVTGGLSFQEAMNNLATRVDSLDIKYFATAVSIQREAGGNLSEILDSLSTLIRQRFDLRNKVRALSAEAKVSAYILFALPILIGGAISILNPGYIAPLFTHPTGKILLGIGCSMMVIGALVTKKMISFKV